MATSLNNLARLYAALNEFKKAHDLLKKGQIIDSKIINQIMGFISEEQKIKFLSMKKLDLYAFISLINQHLSKSSSHRKDALDVWLQRKGIILEAQKRFQETLLYSDDPEVVKVFQELAEIRAKLSKFTFGGPGNQGVEAYKKWITDLEAQKEKLEARLSQLSHAFAIQKKIAKTDSEDVARALPKNMLLLEFAKIERFNFKAKGEEKKWLSPRYIAFILHAGKEARVGMIDLGEALKIDRAIAEFKKENSKIRDIKGARATESSRRIYDLVFANIKKELGDVKEILISPDGDLNLIPFEVLQDPDGKFLIEEYTFNYLAAGRDTLRFGQIEESHNKSLLMGAPDFNLGSDEKVSVLKNLNLKKEDEIQQAKRSVDFNDFRFTPLYYAKEELDTIAMIIGKDNTEVYTDKKALEEVLMSKKSPAILHLATHGFFLKNQEISNQDPETASRGWQVLSSSEPGLSLQNKIARIHAIENPLLRSGIFLAGAKHALSLDNVEKDDGIVTAEKILGLNLRGTKMVVLSACDTGLGEVNAGEGVFGLRRAFTQAGAKSLVMSMWKVPDKETKELMIQFYKNIYSGGMDRCHALRQASLKEMEIVRQRYGHTNPLYWGAFVFMGEP